MDIVIALILFILSSSYVLLLDHLALAPVVLQKALVVPIALLVIATYHSARNSWQVFTNPYDKWFFLLGGTIFVQLLVISTGNIHSPFFALIHIFMIGISFLFNFSIAMIFLLISFIVIFVDISFYHNLKAMLASEPNTIVLQIVSLISITPVAYIVSQQYHAKDLLSGLLKKRVATDEAIFSNLSEMVIVTDAQLSIISINDPAARMLEQARSELLAKPLFNVLLLKNQDDKLVTKDTFFVSGKVGRLTNEFTLVRSPITQNRIIIQAQPIFRPDNSIGEISFIISYAHVPENPLTITRDRARAKYDVLMQSIKKQLLKDRDGRAQENLLLLEKIERDIYMLPLIKTYAEKHETVPIDLAQVCKQIVLVNQDFAKRWNIATNFSLMNFGMEDIAPLTVENHPVKPEDMTGPFFTVNCDVRQVEFAIQKLLDIAIFLASKEVTPHVTLSIERADHESLLVHVIGSCPVLTDEELQDVLVPYYDMLNDKTNLQIGSGLEGFIVKQITEALVLPLAMKYDTSKSEVTFALRIPKKS